MTTVVGMQSTTAVPATWRHLPALDGLRALAVIGVLLFHGGYLEGGFLGVDLFFALSGFLITSLLIRDADGDTLRMTAFWGRRFRRLLPAVFVMIALVALWALLFGTAAELDSVRSDGPWAVVYLANWHLISDAGGYWASFSQPGLFDHLWSLAIEEQFYVVWPLVVVAIWRGSKRPHALLASVCVVGIVASFLTMLLLYDGGDPTRVYMGTDTRAASLLVGALVAAPPARAVVGGLVARAEPIAEALVAVLLVLVVGSWTIVDGAQDEVLYRGGLVVHSAACAVMVVVLASMPDRRVTPRLLALRPLAWLGVLSYGLYLWHWPVYVVLSPDRVGFDGVGLLVVRLAVSLAAAVISYHVVENPIRVRAVWARGRSGALALVASVVALLVFLLTLPEPETEIAQFDPSSVQAPAVDVPATSPDVTVPGVTVPDVTVSAATVPAATVPPTAPQPRQTISNVLWAGDSVAFDMALGVEAALVDAGLGVDPSGAYYGISITKDDEQLRLGTILPPKLLERPADTVLVVVSTWDTGAESDDYRAALEELADVLEQSGVQRLLVVTSPPVGDSDVQAELDRLASTARQLAAEDDRVWFVDAAPAWADPPVVDVDGDGAPERKPDLTHVCPAGAARFGAWLAGELATTFDGVAPIDPARWAAGPWTTDPRFDLPVGACAPT